jgi:nitrate/nitrite transporter NarK
MGTCFGIVTYVDGPNTGTIAGIVGAGGNVGAVIFLNVFKSQGDNVAFTFMSTFCLVAAFLTPLIVIEGYRGILFGKEQKEQPAMLTIPVSAS